ncbi:MAG: hypothetical protein ACJ8DZ_07245 [Allosphingosinicella sp.]
MRGGMAVPPGRRYSKPVGRHTAAFRVSRPGLFALAAAALLLRLLVPAGFMIGTQGGAPALLLCPQVAAAPMHHRGGHQAPAGHAEAPCPFAALSAPALPPPEPLRASAPEPAFAPPAQALPTQQPAPDPASPPPPARGPPAAFV